MFNFADGAIADRAQECDGGKRARGCVASSGFASPVATESRQVTDYVIQSHVFQIRRNPLQNSEFLQIYYDRQISHRNSRIDIHSLPQFSILLRFPYFCSESFVDVSEDV